MLYEPPRPDRYLWDTWLLPVPDEGTYHLFHMQKVAGEPDLVEIGHAVSPGPGALDGARSRPDGQRAGPLGARRTVG